MRNASMVLWLLIGAAMGAAAFGLLDGRPMLAHSSIINAYASGASPDRGRAGGVSEFPKTMRGETRRGGNVSVIVKTKVADASRPSGGHPVSSTQIVKALARRATDAAPPAAARTKLVPFANSAFPHNSAFPPGGRLIRTNSGFSNAAERGVHSDPRVLLHIPAKFDVERPGVLILFYHGHRAALERDVLHRQQAPAQISASGVNAVFAAPQFSVDAADSSPGNLGEPGGLERFLREADEQLAALYGDRRKAAAFSRLPVVIVAYSGGYLAAARALDRGGAKERVQGVVLLDGLYGDLDKFSAWIARNPSSFFISSYTRSTSRQNAALREMLASRKTPFATSMPERVRSGSVLFLAAGSGVTHRDFVTRAWTRNPIQDLLVRLKDHAPEMARRVKQSALASEKK